MTERAFSVVKQPLSASGVVVVKWEGLLKDDQGTILPCPHYADKSIQVKGTFGLNGKVVIEGTNDPDMSEFVTLNDAQGNPLEVTLAKLETILENVYAIRPRVTAGDETTNLAVFVVAHSSR